METRKDMKTHCVITPGGNVFTDIQRAQEMKTMYGYPYRRMTNQETLLELRNETSLSNSKRD